MKMLTITLATIMVTAVAYGQGTVQLNNRIVGVVDARVLLPDAIRPADRSGAGAGFTAQLWGGPQGGTLAPLFPTTDFRTSSEAAMGYVNPVTVTVPGVPAGQIATLQLVAFSGADFHSSVISRRSGPIDVVLGGGNIPPAALVGLRGYTIRPFPEPSTYALGILGLAALMLRRRK